MSNPQHDDLLSHLAHGSESPGTVGWKELDAARPQLADVAEKSDSELAGLIDRINNITEGADPGAATPSTDKRPFLKEEKILPKQRSYDADGAFFPPVPRSFQEANVSKSQVEDLIFKFLLNRGGTSGHGISDQISLPFAMLEDMFQQMKYDRMVVFKGASAMNDYIYDLTDLGRERARRLSQHCTYFGSAPVCLKDYVQSVEAQSLQGQRPTVADLHRAFDDLLINPTMLDRLGPAMNSGRGLFLFGAPGNGKTSIAERITKAFGQYIWIPKALSIEGEIMRLFDPSHHEQAPLEKEEGLLAEQRVDSRWLRIRRPTIVVGGELTMDNLEVTCDSHSNISEAPFQLKSNCGTLVIDDFGRQRMAVDELLNRWIVPLEKRYDILNMANGTKIQVPFDQIIVFSTNLEPRDLVDDAFLRRIPYKIEVTDPTEEEFRELFKIMCPIMGLEHDDDSINYLIETHYKSVNRPFRCCQPRDLLQQIRNWCVYQGTDTILSRENFDIAAQNYFAVM